MTDRFDSHGAGLTAPASHGFSITPSDSAALSEAVRAIYVGTGGSLALTLRSGAAITLTNVPDGSLLPLRTTAVKATGTTASGLVGLL